MLNARSLGVFLSMALAGCGGSAGADDDLERPTCEFTPTALGFDEQSPLGSSAAQTLAPVLGAHSCDWYWNDPSDLGVMRPAPARLTAAVTLEYVGGDVSFIRGERVGGDDSFRLACPSSVSASVRFHVETADGVLNQDIDLPVDLREGYGEASLDVADGDLQGYSFDWNDPWPEQSLRFQFTFDPSGRIQASIREEAHTEPVVVDGATEQECVVFRGADLVCDPD